MEFLNNPLNRWLIAVGLAVGLALGLRLLLGLTGRLIRRISGKTKNGWDDSVAHALGRTKFIFLLLPGLAAGAPLLKLPAVVRTVIHGGAYLGASLQVGLWISATVGFWLALQRKTHIDRNSSSWTVTNAFTFVLQTAIWSVIILFILDSFGVPIKTLLASLGVGGVAVALALQNILRDLFASLSILLDKPFVLGDFLVVDEHLGAVESIGLKTTRIRSLSGEQLVFSNNDLLQSRIRNFGLLRERRVVFSLGVVYQTTAEQLERIPAIIKEAIEAQDKTRFDRSNFQKYGDFALLFETVYYIASPDYNIYMNIQEQINLAIFRRFHDEGIEFAYPTSTVFLEGGPAPRTAPATSSASPS